MRSRSGTWQSSSTSCTLAAQSAFGTLCYYGAPLLLLLSLALHATRQKQVRSFGRRG